MAHRTARALVGALLLSTGAARAQSPQPSGAPPAPGTPAPGAAQGSSPLDVVPDKMPFDVPYGAPIALPRAQAVIAAAEAEATKRGWKMNVAVVDSGGNLVAFARMDGAQLASIDVSQHKARAAVRFRRETKVYEGIVYGGNHTALTLDGVIASRGGIPLVDAGKIVGGVGVSGGTSSQDEVVAKAGAAALGAAAAK